MSITRISLQRLCHGLIALALSLALAPLEAAAAEASHAVSNTAVSNAAVSTDYASSGYLVQLVLGLVLVLICIVALAWFAKRFRYMQSSTAGSMRILGGISMGARERVVLMQVGSTRLLLGVAPGRINTLHVLDQSFDETEAGSSSDAPPDESFAGRLGAAMSRAGRK
jgi:flagellar protein FliO/FliZ